MKFGDTPKDWPENMPTCDSLALGAFGMFDHVNLYGSDSPIGRPVALPFMKGKLLFMGFLIPMLEHVENYYLNNKIGLSFVMHIYCELIIV